MLELEIALELGWLAELCPPLPVGVAAIDTVLELELELGLELCATEAEDFLVPAF